MNKRMFLLMLALSIQAVVTGTGYQYLGSPVVAIKDERPWYQRWNPFGSTVAPANDTAMDDEDIDYNDNDAEEVDGDDDGQEVMDIPAIAPAPVMVAPVEMVRPVNQNSMRNVTQSRINDVINQRIVDVLSLVDNEPQVANFLNDAALELNRNNQPEIVRLMTMALAYMEDRLSSRRPLYIDNPADVVQGLADIQGLANQ